MPSVGGSPIAGVSVIVGVATTAGEVEELETLPPQLISKLHVSSMTSRSKHKYFVFIISSPVIVFMGFNF